jgi:hypothetical protein
VIKKIVNVVAWVEIITGILMLMYSSYLFVEIELLSRSDRHGYGLVFALYLQAWGGLFGFAGLVLKKTKWYSPVPQIILIIHGYYFLSFLSGEL